MKKFLQKSYTWLVAVVMMAVSMSAMADSKTFNVVNVTPGTHTDGPITVKFDGFNKSNYGAQCAGSGKTIAVSCSDGYTITDVEINNGLFSFGESYYFASNVFSASPAGDYFRNNYGYAAWSGSENKVIFTTNTYNYTAVSDVIVTYESASSDVVPVDPEFSATKVTSVKDGGYYHVVAHTHTDKIYGDGGANWYWDVTSAGNNIEVKKTGNHTIYIAEVHDDKVAFKTADGKYLCIKQPNSVTWMTGYSLTGIKEEYDEKYCLFTLESYQTNYVAIKGVRGIENGADHYGYFSITGTGAFNGRDTKIYDNSATCAFFFEEFSAAPTTALGQEGEDYYGSYYANHAWEIPAGYEAYVVTGVDGGQMTLEEITGTVVGANTAVILKGARSENLPIQFSLETGYTNANNMLRGTVEDFNNIHEDGFKYYVMTYAQGGGNLGFYWQYGSGDGSTVNCGAHKAYLRVPAAAGGASNGFAFRFEDTTTGINAIATEKAEAIYNLQGQRVNATAAGVYVKNGKKFIVK